MVESVYIESSVISYLASKPSRDIVVAVRQRITLDWWETQRANFELRISPVVLREIQRGDPQAAQKRLAVIDGISMLDFTEKSYELAGLLMSENAVPAGSADDALHIAIAATQEVDYLLTWNFKHINNAQKKNKIFNIVTLAGFVCPQLCSPEELGGFQND